MRGHALPLPPATAPAGPRSDWATLERLLPYLWHYRWRVGIALAFMVGAKVANVSVPLLLKTLVDSLAIKPGDAQALLVVPIGLLLAYGGLRLTTSLFTELRSLGFLGAACGVMDYRCMPCESLCKVKEIGQEIVTEVSNCGVNG